MPRKLDRIRPGVYHATSLALPARSAIPTVVTLHDLIPWALGGSALRGERLRWWLGRRLLRQADVVIAVSRQTADDARRLAGVDPATVTVVPEAAAAVFAPRRKPRSGSEPASAWRRRTCCTRGPWTRGRTRRVCCGPGRWFVARASTCRWS